MVAMKLLQTVDQSKSGVKVIVYRYKDGSTVDCSCQCFGMPFRCHSVINCPNMPKETNCDR